MTAITLCMTLERKENLIMCMVMKFICFKKKKKNGIIINNNVESLIHAGPPISYNYIYDFPSAAVINQWFTVI